MGVGSLATALVAAVGGRPGPVAHKSEAIDIWGDLLAARVYGQVSALAAVKAS